jgi:hypothetical protein
MTTTRVVLLNNRIMNNNYFRIALQPDANGVSFVGHYKWAKNFTYQTFGYY